MSVAVICCLKQRFKKISHINEDGFVGKILTHAASYLHFCSLRLSELFLFNTDSGTIEWKPIVQTLSSPHLMLLQSLSMFLSSSVLPLVLN